jgi:Uma2 family endonuclease
MGISHALAPFDRVPGGKGVPGGWWILFEPELHLGEDVLVPDLAGWRHERMPEVPDVAAFDLAPDWVCEVVSPRTAAVDRARKLPIYARERVAYVWLVDPLARTLEILRLKDGGWVLTRVHVGPQAVHAEPFETVELDMSAWWLGATAGAHAG